jgi:PAS domain S-box-containing protein
MIIELTGSDEVANEISRTKPDHVRLMDHVAAHLFWDVFHIEEQRIAGLRRIEAERIAARKRIEAERIAEHKRTEEALQMRREQLLEGVKARNVAIVGGGPGCKAIMDIIFAEKLSQLRMKLIGVACRNPKAVGYLYAQEKGIYTTTDYRDLYKLKDLNMIIELTGSDEVANEISRTKPDRVRLMDHVAAHLFWDVFHIEEQRIAALRRIEAESIAARKRIEAERIAERKRTEEALQMRREQLLEGVKARNVAIVGGGPGCKAIMDIIFAEKLSQLRMKLIGVACRNPKAVGYLYAQEKGIYTTTDYRDLYKLKDLNMIIELTGSDEVANEISRTKPDHVRLMDHVAALLFWDVFYIEEQRIATRRQMEEEKIAEHKRTEEVLQMRREQLLEGVPVRNVAIVGGGPGCKAIMDIIFSEKLSQLRMKLIGVSCRNPKAVGYLYAQEKGIYTTTDYRDLYKLKDLHMIIELTGSDEVANEISRTKPDHVRLMDHVAARVFWDVFNVEEQRIAERKRSEEETRLAHAELHQIFETSADGMRVIGRDFNVLRVNQMFALVAGMKKEEIIGKKCYEVFSGPLCHTPECPMTQLLGGEEAIQCEVDKERADGTKISCIVAASPFNGPDGELVGIVEDFRDITERKEAEKALQKAHAELEQRVERRTAKLAMATEQLKLELAERKRTEEALRLAHRDLAIKAADLEAANEELSQYASVVSHDLKAPLRAIRNYTDFLREDLEENLDGDQKMYLDGLKRSVRQGDMLVDDLLEFSRVGRQSTPTQTIDIGVFLKELIASLALSADVEVVMGSDWPTVDTEPTLLTLVFQDLIRNATKFNRSPRKRLEIGCVPVGDDRFEVFVRDNGIGIEPRYHKQIFRMFHRLHTHEEYEGTGLGLAIVRKAVGKLRGSLRLESEAGKGSTFFVTLPKTK